MRFFETLSIAALASVVAAQSANIQITVNPGPCNVGQTCSFDFTTTKSGPVKVVLRKGASGNLKDVEVLSESARPPTFSWTPKSSLAPGSDYAVQVFLADDDFNYSGQFAIVGGTGVTASGSSSASASATGSRTTSAATLSTVTSGSSSSAATISSSASGNSTASITSATLSQSRASTATTHAASGTTSGSGTVPTNAAVKGSSPMAFLFGAVAAVMYLN